MANPFAIAAALAGSMITLTCPHCGYQKKAPRKQVAFRVCPRCKKHFPDPAAAKRK